LILERQLNSLTLWLLHLFQFWTDEWLEGNLKKFYLN
jgi:hypothetical protein